MKVRDRDGDEGFKKFTRGDGGWVAEIKYSVCPRPFMRPWELWNKSVCPHPLTPFQFFGDTHDYFFQKIYM